MVPKMYALIGSFNTLRPRRNGQHFAGDIFKPIFFNENVWILIKMSLTFVPKGPIYNIPSLVQIMAWRHPGDKPLSEQWLGAIQATSHYLNQWWIVYRPIYASLGLNELIAWFLIPVINYLETTTAEAEWVCQLQECAVFLLIHPVVDYTK